MERVIIALIHFAILAGASDPAPITPSPSEDDAPSSVDISSGVGTWVAAGVAIVALVSIVGPWSVLRQSSRDWRRALAGVYDRDGTYIDYVVKFPGSKYRFWRIERIPDLAPLHDENSLSNPPLLAVREVSGLLDWEAPSYRRWNTGWLKLCALIDGLSIAGNDTTAENAIAGNATVENATEENAAAENVAAENTAAENTAAQATSKTATRRATGNDGNSGEFRRGCLTVQGFVSSRLSDPVQTRN